MDLDTAVSIVIFVLAAYVLYTLWRWNTGLSKALKGAVEAEEQTNRIFAGFSVRLARLEFAEDQRRQRERGPITDTKWQAQAKWQNTERSMQAQRQASAYAGMQAQESPIGYSGSLLSDTSVAGTSDPNAQGRGE